MSPEHRLDCGGRFRSRPGSPCGEKEAVMKFLLNRWHVVVVIAIALAGFAALPAAATTSGTNGQISFDRSDGVYTANPDGHGEALLLPNSCCSGWSPDGSKLAVPYGLADDRIGTATINADGTGYDAFPI